MKKTKRGMCAFLATLLAAVLAMSFAACDFEDESDGGSMISGRDSATISETASETDTESTTVSEISSDESSDDESIIGHEHTYKINVQTNPSNTSEGCAIAVCKGCGDEKVVVLPKYSSENYKVDGLKNIDCSVGGTIYYSISIYGETLVFKENVKAGHYLKGRFVDSTEIITLNDDNMLKNIHLFESEKLSCNTTADAWFTCVICEGVILTKVKKEHLPQNGWSDDLKIYQDCELGGKSKDFICATCGEIVSVKLSPRDHSYEYNLIDGNGKMLLEKTCKICGKKKTSKAENVVVTEEEPSKCSTEGFKVYAVKIGEQTISVKVTIPKSNHKFFGKDIGSIPTFYIEDGAKLFYGESAPYCMDDYSGESNGYFICTDCEQLINVVVRRHLAPTDTSKITYKDGFKVYVCEKCGKEINERV